MTGSMYSEGLWARFAGSATAKVAAIAGATLMGVTATAAAGALPGPAQRAVAGVLNSVSPLKVPGGAKAGVGVTASTEVGGPNHPSVGVGAEAGGAAALGGSTAAGASGSVGGTAAAGLVPGVDIPIPGLPDLPDLPDLPIPVPSCVTSIIDPGSGQLLVGPTQLASKVLACVQSSVPGGLPAPVSQCLSSVLGAVQGVFAGGVPSGIPNVAGCVPIDVSQCTSSVTSLLGSLTSLPGLANIGNLGNLLNLGQLGNLTNLGNLTGCVPVDVTTCVSSILGSVTSGTLPTGVPSFDLSACVPVGLPGGIG